MQMYFYGIEYCITFDVSFTVLTLSNLVGGTFLTHHGKWYPKGEIPSL